MDNGATPQPVIVGNTSQVRLMPPMQQRPEDSGVHRAIVKHAKWILPTALTLLGTGIGWALKSARDGAVTEERVRVLSEQQAQVNTNTRDIAGMKSDVGHIRESVEDVKVTAKEINEKLERLSITERRRGR